MASSFYYSTANEHSNFQNYWEEESENTNWISLSNLMSLLKKNGYKKHKLEKTNG